MNELNERDDSLVAEEEHDWSLLDMLSKHRRTKKAATAAGSI